MVVPVLALALPLSAMFERLQSQAMREVIHAAVRAGRAGARRASRPGSSGGTRSSLGIRPVASIYGLVVGTLLSGSFAVEIVTAWPGLGQLMLDALRARDVYLVAGCAAAGSVFLAAGTLLSDAALALVDPRVSRVKRAACSRSASAIVAIAAALRARRCVARHRCTVSRAAERAADAVRCRDDERAAGAVRSSIPGSGSASSNSDTSTIARRRCRSRWFSDGRLVGSSDRCVRRCCCSAPTATAATSSAGCFTARGCRSGSRCWRRFGAMVLGTALGGVAGYVGGAMDDLLMRASDFVLVLPAMYVALALRSVMPLVLTPAAVFLLLARNLRRRRRSVHLPRRPRHRPHRARARLRGRRRVARRRPFAGAGPASAAGRARVHRRRTDAARAGVHRGRSDAVVCRARVSRSGGELGHDAAGRLEHPRASRIFRGC